MAASVCTRLRSSAFITSGGTPVASRRELQGLEIELRQLAVQGPSPLAVGYGHDVALFLQGNDDRPVGQGLRQLLQLFLRE